MSEDNEFLWPGEDEEEAASEPAAPRLVLVDVQAVAEGAEPLRTLWQGNRGEAVTRLVNVLSWALGTERAEFVLVVDRLIRVTGKQHAAGTVHLHPTSGESSVSETLLKLIEHLSEEGRSATIVSSDLDVVRRAAEQKFQAVLGDLFAISLLGGISNEERNAFPKPEGLSEAEQAEWDAFVARWEKEQER